MCKRVGRVVVVWNEIHGSLLLKVQVHQSVLEVIGIHFHVVPSSHVEVYICGLDG